jgi:2-dehydro-3-deoxyphosphogluconate aldolase/(4S)-4-hydroxy-2-oxoglutarate aldolase
VVQENQVSEREKIVSGIEAEGLVAIVRVPRLELALPLAKALVAGGIRAVELTMSIPNALEAIRTVDRELGDEILLGIGTVIDDDTCRAAIDAGAKYVISPITRPSLVAAAHALDRPVMLGAYTPTEAQTAHEAGADFVKIFPADTLGPSYIKSLLAPLPHLKIIPTGGVNLDTMEAYLAAGSAALGTGSALLKKEIIAGENWGELERLAKRFADRMAGLKAKPGR